MKILIKILKIIGAVFCGLMTLGGSLSILDTSTGELDILVLVITILFFAITVVLICNLYKNRPRKKTPVRDLHSASTSISRVPEEKTGVSHSLHTSIPVRGNTQVTTAKPTMNLFASYRRIPTEIFNLLWFSNGPFQNYSEDATEYDFDFSGFTVHIKSSSLSEPSAIDVDLPFADSIDSDTPLGYYPSYENLTPQQRTSYLNWLIDITAPIDIGYVFIFYYGLERHLFLGKSDAALATILILRKFHKNKSFLTYSADALTLYALIHNSPEVMQQLDFYQLHPCLCLFYAVLMQHSLSAEEIISAHKNFSFDNTRYIKSEPSLFKSTLESLIIEKYGSVEIPVSLEDLRAAKVSFTIALANYSLLPEQRVYSLPDISTTPHIHDSIHLLLTEAHESVKVKLREIRKAQK